MAKIKRSRRKELRAIVRESVAQFVMSQELEAVLAGVAAEVFDAFTEEERDYVKTELKELCGRINYKPADAEEVGDGD